MNLSPWIGSIVVLAALVSAGHTAPTRTSTEIAKITASDGIPGDAFRLSVAASGDDLIVGAPTYTTATGNGIGAVYFFRRNGWRWVEITRLVNEQGFDNDKLGWSVAIEGDVAVAGAPHLIPGVIGGGYGFVFIFRRSDGGTPDDPFDDQ